MATNKPRLTITLTHRQYELVKTLSDSSGQSMSAFIVEYLELAQPILESMAVAYQKIKQADSVRKDELKRSIEAAEKSLRPLVESVNNQVDFFFSNVHSDEVPAGGVRVNDTTADGADSTPATNRGVTKLKNNRKNGLQAASNKDSSESCNFTTEGGS